MIIFEDWGSQIGLFLGKEGWLFFFLWRIFLIKLKGRISQEKKDRKNEDMGSREKNLEFIFQLVL